MNNEILNTLEDIKKSINDSDSEITGFVLNLSFKDNTGDIYFEGNRTVNLGLIEELKEYIHKQYIGGLENGR